MKNPLLISLSIERLHHAEFGQLMVRLAEDFANTSLSTATDADFKTMYDGIQAQIPTFNSALNQIKASEESKEIAQLDAVRDAAFQNLINAIKPYHNSAGDEANAYTALSILLSEYKDVKNANYESETNQLNTLADRLESTDYAPHIAELGIEKFITRMKDANIAFNNLFSQRSFKTSQKVVYDVKALRKTLTADYNQMVNYIASNAPVKSDSFYKDVLGVINNGRMYYSNVILSRRNTKKSE